MRPVTLAWKDITRNTGAFCLLLRELASLLESVGDLSEGETRVRAHQVLAALDGADKL
jgi:hypothetical protein